jgi:hypothetical protein
LIPAASLAPNTRDRWVFSGLEQFELLFLDNKVISIAVIYDLAHRWARPDDFLVGFSNRVGVSLTAWQVSKTNSGKELDCGSFDIVAFTTVRMAAMLSDKSAFNLIEQRNKALNEEERKKGHKLLDFVYY